MSLLKNDDSLNQVRDVEVSVDFQKDLMEKLDILIEQEHKLIEFSSRMSSYLGCILFFVAIPLIPFIFSVVFFFVILGFLSSL